MKLGTIKYRTLIEMGFTRHDIDDDVLFKQTGYYGFNLEIEFDLVDVGISSGCFMSNEQKAWDFKLYKVSTGGVIRRVELIELKTLIEFFQYKSEEIEQALGEVEKIKKEVQGD